MTKTRVRLLKHLYKLPLLLAVVLILGVAIMPTFLSGKASAIGQITNRSLTISSGVPSATGVTYSFTFTVASTSQVQGIKLIACTLAVATYPGNTGSCTAPTGFSGAGGGFSSVTYGSQSGWQGATNFAVDATGANDCVPSGTNHNIICANRTDTTSQTVTSRTITFGTIKNPSAVNTPFYIGIYTYTTTNYTSASRVDFGATASAVVQTLTTNAAVAEILNFCVGSTTVDDPDTLVASDCTGVSGTSVNLGTLDTSTINITPWSTNCPAADCGLNAVAMVRSNAGNGTVVSYDAIQQSGTNHQGTLRISGATCNPISNTFTDQCINAAGTTQTTFTAGTEEFGMTIAGINSGSTTSYSCTYGGGSVPHPPGDTCNLKPLSNYLGAGTAGSSETYGTTNGFAWDESGTAVNIASSSSSTVKQIDDEAIIMKYAATPSITTPFGPYQAQTDFIAVPTY